MTWNVPVAVILATAAAALIAAVPAAGIASEGPSVQHVPFGENVATRGAHLATTGLALLEGPLEIAGGAVMAPAAASPRGPKNPMVAILLSAVLPGWGEIYTGHDAKGRAFMATEAAIWLAYAGFSVQEGMRKDDYREYALVFAGVEDGDAGYYQDIADYIRSEGYDSYNEAVRDEARSLYPDDPAAQDAYFAEHGYFGDGSWEWASEERFRHYRELRNLAGDSRRKAFYMTGLAVLNRAVSAIDSAWMARRRNDESGGAHASLSVGPDLSDGHIGARAALVIEF